MAVICEMNESIGNLRFLCPRSASLEEYLAFESHFNQLP